MMRLAADKRSMGNPGARTSSSWMPVATSPGRSAARRRRHLERGRKVAILVGRARLNAREEVTQVADLLGAPVAKALLGKAVWRTTRLHDRGDGHLGTGPSSWAMRIAIRCLSSARPCRGSTITRSPVRRGASRST